MTTRNITIVVLSIIILSGCAAPVEIVETSSKPDNFWHGLLHGIIFLFSFIGSLFNENIVIYNPNNIGGWYDFGFLLGLGGSVGSAVSSGD